MDDMTWKAVMDSEVFRIYAENEAKNIQQQKITAELVAKQAAETADEDAIKVMEEFEQFERDIKASPNKLKVFQALQEKFASDPEYTSKVKKSFVDSVMLLNLD